MLNFSITKQIEKELEDFRTSKVRLASMRQNDNIRYLNTRPDGYYFNQGDAIALIDLYYNSKFESGAIDKLGQRKIFMNVGKFRTDVSAKQTIVRLRDFRFIPDEYADPWMATFLQKDLKEWAKDTYFEDLLAKCVDNFPKYGTIVLKQVKKDVQFVPLQNLRNEQTAESLQKATYVIEEHPDMHIWEIEDMPGWNSDDLELRYDETMTVYERYGHVTLRWLKMQNGETPADGDENVFVDALAIVGKSKHAKSTEAGWHVFFAQKITKRPYLEAHWDKQHGRWLGTGVMEDLVENQEAKNIIVNLLRRSLHWSSKRIAQSRDSNVAAKNLAVDVQDGDILEVGPEGAITTVDLTNRALPEFQQFLNEWEKNSDQKAFTYEVATGESLPSGTPFRLGVLLSSATNTFFAMKRSILGRFFNKVFGEFMIPQFLKDMSNEERTLAMFSGEDGFEVVKEAAMNYVRNEAARLALLSGKKVDVTLIESAIEPWQAVEGLFIGMSKTTYEEAKFKFDFTVTGDNVDLQSEIETWKTLYQIFAQQGDPRAEKVLERIISMSGHSLDGLGMPTPSHPVISTPTPRVPTLPQSQSRAALPALTTAANGQ